jgi:plasmid maintenance system antidote protein VapI
LNEAKRLTCWNDLNGRVLPDTAIGLGTFFKTSAEFWMNLQMTYDLRNAEKVPPARVRKSIEDNRSVLA